ncbi:MAG: stimulus-sensing domain-containing protein, partial [Alphaproteobacteria bacterium]|nr:stimulus-sensing domain-containing protein [Alphaproteobacteria bacterium]
SLTLRILAPNVLALAILVAGVFYLDQYRGGLIDAKIVALQTQAEVIAGALGESALTGPVEDQDIDPIRAGGIVSRLVEPTETRARLFGREGAMIADSRALISAGRQVQLKYLAPPSEGNFITDAFLDAYDWVMPRLPSKERFPLYTERVDQRAEDYSETRGALAGEVGGAIRQDEDGGLIVSVAVPVQQLHIVLGAVMLTADSGDIEDSVRRVQAGIIQVFAVTLGVTVLMSMFLAGTIARPVKRLARAADQVRRWRGQRVEIPDLSHRRDEIGDLSGALREMTAALYARLDAIDAFAADVAHELKNPLTSLQSAVESLARTADPAQREKLFQVIVEDVRRLDRLITDISNASRVDAELSRAETETIDLAVLLETVVELHGTRLGASSPHLELRLPDGGPIRIEGVASRLGQVVDNLLSNAVSFSPPDGTIRLSLTRRGGMAEIAVEDEGPGLPEDWMDRLFERFYSARPEGEAFGRHSGLGLSIARQVVEAHGGTIVGENRLGGAGAIVGARFVVRLPL